MMNRNRIYSIILLGIVNECVKWSNDSIENILKIEVVYRKEHTN